MAPADPRTLPVEAGRQAEPLTARARERGARARARLFARAWLAPLVILVLSAGVLASMVVLRDRERAFRDTEVALANIGAQFARIGVSPIQLASGFRSPAEVSASMRTLERQLADELAGVRRNLPAMTFAAVSTPVQANVRVDNQARALFTRDPRLHSPGSILVALQLASVAEANSQAAATAIRDAENQAGSNASSAAVEATVASALTIVLLLSAFFFFYRRSLRARAAAEALAAALGHSERHLAQAQRLAGVGSWEWRAADGRLIWSEQQARLHRWPHPQPPSTTAEALALIDAPHHGPVASAIEALWRDGSALSIEYSVTGPDGPRLIHCQGDRACDEDGRPIGLIGTCQDVTDRFRRLEAERASAAKSEFLSRTSHELRTPLNAILGFAQLLALGDLDDRQRANVDHVVRAGRHLLRLVDEVLEIAADVDAHAAEVARQAVAIGPSVSDAVGLVAPLAETHGVELTVACADDDVHVLADSQRLAQVLLNLLANAIKYNRAGGHVDVAVQARAQAVTVAISDDGPGIAPELQARLFTPFDRLGAEHGPVAGSGLGLALSKSYVDAMGGTLGVNSAPGRGSTFSVTLGRADAPATAGRALAGSARAG
jgi:signal transduction histidine kinase